MPSAFPTRPADLVPLSEARHLLPPVADGKPVHVHTLKRWIRRGELRGWVLTLRQAKYRRLYVSRAEVEALVSGPPARDRDTAAAIRAVDAFWETTDLVRTHPCLS